MMEEFRKTEAEFRALKESCQSGTISRKEFLTRYKGLRIHDDRNYWMLGADSGLWYVFKGGKWTRQDPGQAVGPPPAQEEKQGQERASAKPIVLKLAIGIFIAAWALAHQWPASQIIWQFWASSLLFGTLFFIAGVIIKAKSETPFKGMAMKRKYFILASGAIMMGIIALLPILFFHSIYALFLNHLFPILDWDPMGKHIGMVIPFTWEILVKCIASYWLFLAVMFLAKINDLIRLKKSGDIRVLLDPFKAVVQMHVLILAFGFFSHALKLSANAMYLLLIFGFFQISDLLTWLKPFLGGSKTSAG